MSKRPNLAEQIKFKAMGKAVSAAQKIVETPEMKSRGKGAKSAQSPSRAGKSFIGGYFPPEVAKQMKLLAVEQDTTIQALTAEAFNHLFAAYGKPEIAPGTD